MFSPYYAWARRRGGLADPENHVALNVVLYGAAGKRWTMTERGRAQMQRSASSFTIGPSSLHWDGESLRIDIDEWSLPLPQRVRGRVRVWPRGFTRFVTALDTAGRHRWGPIAPCARVDVSMDQPAARWSGHAYLDSNEGDEPIDRPFSSWDWSRATLADGSTAVIYDLRERSHGGRPPAERVIAQRFMPDGRSSAFEPAPRQALPPTRWRVARGARAAPGAPARVLQTLDDTPFYARSLLQTTLFGERVTAVHESLSLPRLVSWPVQLMLPWRMPRRS